MILMADLLILFELAMKALKSYCHQIERVCIKNNEEHRVRSSKLQFYWNLSEVLLMGILQCGNRSGPYKKSRLPFLNGRALY